MRDLVYRIHFPHCCQTNRELGQILFGKLGVRPYGQNSYRIPATQIDTVIATMKRFGADYMLCREL
jgi:hypothetical protein